MIFTLSQYLDVVQSVESNPENTMMVALTQRDVALIAFATNVIMRLFPEVVSAVIELLAKMLELSDAQGFLPWREGEVEEILSNLDPWPDED